MDRSKMSGANIYQKGDFLHRVEFGNDYNPNGDLIPQPILISADGNLISASHSNLPISLKKILVESKTMDDEGGSEKLSQVEIVIHAQAFNGQQAHIRCRNDINELKTFLNAIKTVSTDHNLDNINLEPIRVETLEVLYRNEALTFSALRERKLRFALVWKEWKPRVVQIYSNGTISYANVKHPTNLPRHKFFSVRKITATLMTDESISNEEEVINTGLIIKCHTLDGIESYFRCIMNNKELTSFLAALRTVAEEHNLDSLQEANLEVKKAKKASVLNLFRSKASIMRQAVSSAMDSYDQRTRRERTLSKRGAFKWLPVVGANDLIHGSWWFVFGSIGSVITTAVVINNKYTHVMNDDNSDLSLSMFETSWALLLISSLFSTLGSLAFVRAFNEDPPMAPLFPTWYHFQSDELLGSWFFFFCTLPFVPYVFIYVVEYNFGYIYLIVLLFAIIANLGAWLFVRACYPVENVKEHRDLLLPMSKYLCFCCCSEKWRKHHFLNDWLGVCWIFYWLSLFACFPFFIIFLKAIADHDDLQMFVFGTSTVESIAFTIGSACFVAGSYPEGYNELDISQSAVGDAVYNPTHNPTDSHHSHSGHSNGSSQLDRDDQDVQLVRIGFSDFSSHRTAGYNKVDEDVV